MALFGVHSSVSAQTENPVPGHYPPGQSGIRGAATPQLGTSYTNFNRFFSKIEAKDSAGNTLQPVGHLGYANISMI